MITKNFLLKLEPPNRFPQILNDNREQNCEGQ